MVHEMADGMQGVDYGAKSCGNKAIVSGGYKASVSVTQRASKGTELKSEILLYEPRISQALEPGMNECRLNEIMIL